MPIQTRLGKPDDSGPETWPGAAAALLAADPRLRVAIQNAPTCRIQVVGNPFEALALIVLYQQISGAVAERLAAKVRNLHPGALQEPRAMLAVDAASLAALGIPQKRIATLHDVAQRVVDGRLDLETLRHCSDAEVQAALQEIPGLGPWSSGMFLLFHLERPDVFLPGDVGIRRALHDLTGQSFASAQELLDATMAWSPWRSAAMWYLWHSIPGFPTPGIR